MHIRKNTRVFLVQLREHIITANIPGLGGVGGLRLEKIDCTDVVDSSNERS